MTYQQMIEIFKGVADDLCPAPLNFLYDRVWAMNGVPSITYPAMLVESQPNFNLDKFQHNNRTGLQIFKGKIFFFDLYQTDERATKVAYIKQSELNELMHKILAECKKRFDDAGVVITWGEGFFGQDVHNAKLVEVFVPYTVSMQNACTLGDFTTCHV